MAPALTPVMMGKGCSIPASLCTDVGDALDDASLVSAPGTSAGKDEAHLWVNSD